MAKPNHAIAIERAAQERAPFRPPLRSSEDSLDKSFGNPSVVNMKGQINMDQCIGDGESLPSGRSTTKSINDPFVTVNQFFVGLEVIVASHFLTAGSKLE